MQFAKLFTIQPNPQQVMLIGMVKNGFFQIMPILVAMEKTMILMLFSLSGADIPKILKKRKTKSKSHSFPGP